MDIGNQWCLCSILISLPLLTLKIRLFNSGLNVQCHFNSTWASSTVVIDITACTDLNIIVKSPSINQYIFFHIEVLLISICPGFTWDRVDFFFIVSGMMLSSGFKRKPVLIKYWYFTCCWAMPYRTKDFSVSQLLVLLCQWGAQFVGETWPDSSLKLASGIFHIGWCHVKKKLDNGGKLAGGAVVAEVWLGICWQVVSNSVVYHLFCRCVCIVILTVILFSSSSIYLSK